MRRPARTISLSSRKWWSDAQSASLHHPRARAARPGDLAPRARAAGQGIGMCEEGEPLTVAYFGKADRKGWRPPATARSVPVHDDGDMNARLMDDRIVSGRPHSSQG